MKCSAYIATSVDGFIATNEGGVDWLQTAGNGKELTGDNADMGFKAYLSSVDCMIMGRKCMETISAMGLRPEQWPYGDLRIIVLSNTLNVAPENMEGKIELFSGNLLDLIDSLHQEGHKHAYIDGGTTIQSFIKLKLLSEITITKAPVLLGEGIPLFGKVAQHLRLDQANAICFENDFIQIKYHLHYQT
ncbi:MAG: dihydrofolate reductase family protein [Crocinitomicaceae bacterium]